MGILLLSSPINAQKTYSKNDVRAMFRKSTKNLWINYLSGTLDGHHIVDMIMGSDGNTCRGLYTLRESGDTFYFDGIDKNHILSLAEYSTDDMPTGTIKGTYDGEILEALWFNIERNRQMSLSLSIVNNFENFKKPTLLSQQWLRVFSGQIEGQNILLKIERQEDIYLITHFKETTSETYSQNGKDLSIEIFNTDFRNSPLSDKSIMIESNLPLRADILFKEENGYSSTSSLNLLYKLDYESYTYADFNSILIGELPRIYHKKFDAWIEKETLESLESIIKKHKKLKYGEVGLRNKWMHKSECWVEIDLYNKDWISGTLMLQSSLQKEVEKHPFIFDLKSSKILTIEDFLINKSDKAFIIEKALYNAIDFEKNLQNRHIEDFKYVTMSSDGFKFSTDFCSIYGEKTLYIPFESIEQYLKNKNLLRSLLLR